MPNRMIYVRDADVPLFERAERYAERHRTSLSALIATALQEYLERATHSS
jgi:hypothetical protein